MHNHFSFVVARCLEIVKAASLPQSTTLGGAETWRVPRLRLPQSLSGAPDPIVLKLLNLSSFIDL